MTSASVSSPKVLNINISTTWVPADSGRTSKAMAVDSMPDSTANQTTRLACQAAHRQDAVGPNFQVDLQLWDPLLPAHALMIRYRSMSVVSSAV